METETWLRKLERIDARIFYLIMLILLAVPMIRPFRLPIYAYPLVYTHYETIDRLQPGDRAFIWHNQPPGIWPDVKHGAFAMVQHLFLKPGVIIITAGGGPASLPLMAATIRDVWNPLNKTEGTDYVQLPFIPGGEAALAALARNFRAAIGTRDLKGNPLDTLPALEGVNTLGDFNLIIDLTNGPEQMVRQFYVRYPTPETGIHYLHHVTIAFTLKAYPFLGAGFTAVTGGTTQGVMYQQLLNLNYGAPFYAGGIEEVDGFVGVCILTIILVVLGNLRLINEKMKKQGVKQ